MPGIRKTREEKLILSERKSPIPGVSTILPVMSGNTVLIIISQVTNGSTAVAAAKVVSTTAVLRIAVGLTRTSGATTLVSAAPRVRKAKKLDFSFDLCYSPSKGGKMFIWMIVIIVLGGVLAFVPENLLLSFRSIRPLLGVAIMLIAVGVGISLSAKGKGKKIEK